MLKRIIPLITIVLAIPFMMMAQVTTSNISGNVKAANGESLTGATITATHLPSGTVYATIAKKDGVFNLQGLRVGGPYTIKIDFVGQKSQVFDNVFLQLGETFNVNAILGADEKELTGVIITGRGRRAATDKGGMSSVFNSRVLSTLPTISRNITDFTRGTPQANGTNFAGRDARFNNITVDGANLNNNFGLSTDPLPGAGNNPVSLDAIEEVSVSIAPFDVRQGNFTGANISAITKSGTNIFHGTAYTYWQNQRLVGDRVGKAIANNPAFKSSIYGGSIGGPIIKNKLFFFINGEIEKKPPASGITWTPKGGSGAGNISDVPIDSMRAVANYLNTAFEFDPGVYDNFPAFKNENFKVLGKIDWNISKAHKLTLKYSHLKGTQDFLPSQSGNINGANGQSGIVTYGPKFSKSAMGFSGVSYVQEDIVRSASLELNSNFRSRFANQFLATITKITSFKVDGHFPFVDILGITSGDKNNYISAGNEPFNGNNNKVLNDIYTITDNFSYFAGKNTLTLGLSYEYQRVGNMFMAGSQGYYVYRNVDDFIKNRAPQLFSITYSLDKAQDAIYSANLKIGQLAAYFQDEINVNSSLKITAGIRIDKPIYPEQPKENPAVSALSLVDHEGVAAKYTTGQWPKSIMLLSPRIGFRWDMEGDKSMILRGGTGIYTGRIPFVYLTNIPSNSGMYQFGTLITPTTPGVSLNNFLFNPDHHAYNPFYNTSLPANLFPTTAGSVAPAVFAVTSKDFKFPQIWRTNIAIDKQLNRNWKLTIEAMYTKDINAVYMFNANQKAPDATVTTGTFTRGRYSASTAAVRRLNLATNNVIVLDNTNKGNSFVFTAQLAKSFAKGWYATIAYNYTYSVDVTANPGSQAASVWSVNPTTLTQNDLQLFYSNFAVPHRLVGGISYHFEYLKHLGTTISLFYDGRSGGTYSYIYNGDLNQDGNTADLMYIPKNAKDPNEIQFQPSFAYPNGVTYTAADMGQIFETYIQQDPYLRKHRGQVAERNGAKLPWFDRLDMKAAQDIFTNIGRQRNTIQVTADVYNVLNLINHDWGVRKITTLASNNPLTLVSVTNGIPQFRLNTFNNAPVNKVYQNNISTSTTWAIQIGVRYIF